MISLNKSRTKNKTSEKISFYSHCSSIKHFTRFGFKKVIFENIRLNNDPENKSLFDKFIVPYNGVYCFSAGARISGIIFGYAGLGLFINHSLYTMIDYTSSPGGPFLLQGTASIFLSKGDIVDLRTTSTIESNCYLHKETIGSYIWFSGYILYKDLSE